jgi:hypothetical protein
MKQSKVYLTLTNDDMALEEINSKLANLIDKIKPFQNIKKDNLVAIKLHFGEEENVGYINPDFVSTIVKAIKKRNAKVFLTDTNTLYKGSRTNTIDHLDIAYRHGFRLDRVGASVVIADGIKSDEDQEVKLKGKFIKSAYIATGIYKADFLVVISHFKGHIMAGFGGAIKNLGMGCASRRGKLVQHGGVAPFVKIEKCVSCGLCIKSCPVEAIKFVNKKAKINSQVCIGCAGCIAVCPISAIDVQWEKGADTINEKIVEYAKAAITNKKDNCIYFNFAIKITKDCDCIAKDEPKICPDIGIFVSFDPVAIDQACVDKINQISKKDIFRQQHPNRDWQRQLEHSTEIGLGRRTYELVQIK